MLYFLYILYWYYSVQFDFNWLNSMYSVEVRVSMTSKILHDNSMLYRSIIGPPIVYSIYNPNI